MNTKLNVSLFESNTLLNEKQIRIPDNCVIKMYN